MSKYIICEKCNSLVEYSHLELKYEGGTSYTVFTCPECGYVKKSSTNHIHYGEDGRK